MLLKWSIDVFEKISRRNTCNLNSLSEEQPCSPQFKKNISIFHEGVLRDHSVKAPSISIKFKISGFDYYHTCMSFPCL